MTATYLNPGRRSPAGLLIMLAGVAAACSSGSQPQTDNRGRGGPAAVAVAEVGRRDLSRDVALAAPVEPIRLVGVNARAAGTILSVKVVEGDRVRPGQLMAELDTRETAAQLERARAVLQNARAAFERAEQLRSSQIITDAEFEVARAAFGAAESDLELWTARLDFGRIVSPTAGVVTIKHIEAGSAVSANQRTFDVADDALLVVRVQMSELDVVHVRVGDTVSVRLDAQPGLELKGAVRRVFPAADATTRLVPVEVALATGRSGAVRPGFLARVHFGLERRRQVVAVPAAAVGAGSDGTFAYLVNADTLVRRSIRTGMTSAGWVEVAEGLIPGELVVISGHANLRAGAAVRITEGMPQGDSALAAAGH